MYLLLYFVYFVTGVTLLLTTWWCYIISTRYYKLCSKIPGPNYISTLRLLYLVLVKRCDFIKVFTIFSEKYYPIGRVFFGSLGAVFLQDPDDVRKILFSKRTVNKGVSYSIVSRMFGKSMLTEDRQDWRRYRRTASPAFRTSVLRGFLNLFNEKSKNFIITLTNKANGKPFDIFYDISLLAFSSVSESQFGVGEEIYETHMSDFFAAFHENKEVYNKVLFSLPQWSVFVYNFTINRNIVNKNFNIFNNFVREVLRSKRENFESDRDGIDLPDTESVSNGGKKELGYLDYILHVKNSALTEEELENQLKLLAMGGMDTTAFTLSACLMLLGIHQDVQSKVARELEDIFGEDKERSAEYEDIQKMAYLEQVIKETMRLFPIAFMADRRIDEEIVLGGYNVPSGTIAIISPFLLHRNKKYFPDPLKFDPERFSPVNIGKIRPCSYIPFLAGPRMCLGHNYAMLQMKTVLSHVLRTFEILPHGTREEMEELGVKFLLYLKRGYYVRMKVKCNSR